MGVVSSVISVHAASRNTVDHGSENSDWQAIQYRQLCRRELPVRDALAQDNEDISCSSTEGVRIDARNERWRIDDHDVEFLSSHLYESAHFVGDEQLRCSAGARSAREQKQILGGR